MRKLFLFISALILSMMMNANVINISPNGDPDLRHAVRDHANAGDTIVLADGAYVQAGDYTKFDKDLVVMAATGAAPVVKLNVPAYLLGGSRVVFKGIKFDMENSHSQSWYSHLISVEDEEEYYDEEAQKNKKRKIKVDGNKLIFDGCEFYNDTLNNSVIFCEEKCKIDSVIVNDCKFYDIKKSCIFLENTDTKGLIITNSSFYNISTKTGSYWAGVIDTRSSSAVVRIDHCTFYNVQAMNTDYAAIGKIASSNSIVSNCIFAMPTSTDDLRAIRDVTTANNCLTFNYTKDSNWGIHSGVQKNNCIQKKDPLFVDAANANFKLHLGSPAIGADTDGKDLGDPRWSKVAIPSTDFSDPLVLIGADAILANKIVLTGNWSLQSKNTDKAEHAAEFGTATWTFNATKACAVQVTINMDPDSAASGHNYHVEIFDNNNASKGALEEGEWCNNTDDKLLSGMIFLPKAGKYTVVLSNNQEWSRAVAKGITLSYIEGGDVVEIPNALTADDAWFAPKGTRADDMITFSTYKNQWVKWNATIPGSLAYAYDVALNIYSPSKYGHRFSVKFYEKEDEEPVYTLTESSWNESYGTPLAISMGKVNLDPAKNYIVEVTNAENGAQPKIISVSFAYSGGNVQNMPETTNINDAWFSPNGTRADGKIDFPNSDIQNGWVKWNVAFADGGSYKAKVKVNTDSGHNYTVKLYRGKNDTNPITFANGAQYSQKGSPIELEINAQVVEAGSYIMEVVNSMQNSDAELISVEFIYSGGATINIPNAAIPLNEAILQDGATRDSEGLHFKNAQYVEWNIHATEGLYTFSATCTSSTNYSNLTIKVKQGANELYSYTPAYDYKTTDKVISSPQWVLEAGDYILELSNPTSGNGYVTALAATAPEGMLILNENKTDDGSIATADYSTTSTRFDVYLKRSFTAGKYYTICVPFDSYDSQLESRFGTGYELWKMVSAEQVGEEINLNFEQINGDQFAAGVPYIIKPTKNVENPTFSQKKILNNSTTRSFDAANFIGTFYKDEIPAGESNLYLQNNELFYNESHDTPIKGTRAWIQLKPQGQSAPKARIVMQGNVATEINLVNGEIVEGTIKTIENGQLIIIRDGQKFNVMGAKIQ